MDISHESIARLSPLRLPNGGRASPGRRTSVGIEPKRLYDALFAVIGLAVLSPLFALIGALVKLSDGGSALFWQTRIGRFGRPFRICKFRTMITVAESAGPAITKQGDVRITGIGRILRKTKLDELPQLWNVLKGEMSLVGPRPEVPRYVERYTPEQRAILRLKPGITDLASLRFRGEEALLRCAGDVENFYIRHCIPRKLKLNLEYAARASLWSDTWIILQTLCPDRIAVSALHAILLAATYCLACALIRDFAAPVRSALEVGRELGVVVVFQIVCLTWRNQCRGLLSYFSGRELRQLAAALAASTVLLLGLGAADLGVPARNVLLLDGILAFAVLSGFRGVLRMRRERPERDTATPDKPPLRVGIIGAGTRGAQLALELTWRPKLGRIPVAFFDDDSHKWQKHIHDIPVVGMPECLVGGWATQLDEVVIALPEGPRSRIAEISRLLDQTALRVVTVDGAGAAWPPHVYGRP